MPHARRRGSKRASGPLDPVIDFQHKMYKLGYVTGDRHLLATGHALTEYIGMTTGPVPAMLLQGPPGTGKTFWAKTFQRFWSAVNFLTFQFTPGVTKEDLMFDLDLANIATAQAGKWRGEFTAEHAIRPGVFAQALLLSQQAKTVLLLDELDKANEKVDAFLLEYLEDCAMSAGALGRITGNPHNLVVFTTMNNQRLITEPLMRRHFRVEMHWPKPEVERQLVRTLALKQLKQWDGKPRVNVTRLSTNIVRLANEVRAFEKQLKKVPSTPELARAVASCAVLPEQDWGYQVEAELLAYPGDREIARDLWGKSPATIARELLRS